MTQVLKYAFIICYMAWLKSYIPSKKTKMPPIQGIDPINMFTVNRVYRRIAICFGRSNKEKTHQKSVS